MAFPDILGNRSARNDHARVGVCLGVVPLSDLDILFPVVAAKEHEKLRFQRAVVIYPCADQDAPAPKDFSNSSDVNHKLAYFTCVTFSQRTHIGSSASIPASS